VAVDVARPLLRVLGQIWHGSLRLQLPAWDAEFADAFVLIR
jgi:hypothetical protein